MNHPEPETLTLDDYGWSAHFRRAGAAMNLPDVFPARVMAVHRDALDVAGPEFSGRIPMAPAATEDARPVTGDWVALSRATRRLLAVYPRASLFKRRSAGTAARVQLIAANVDTVLVVTSANQEFNVARLERYLAMAREAEVTPVVVITKADLAGDAAPFIAAARAAQHDLMVEAIDARSSAALAQLAPWLGRGQTLALMGSSGVGKSTIVNTLMGAAVQDTGGIRVEDAHGRHTTSGRSLHRMPTGAWLMDTPGMRELQIVDVSSGIAAVFDDVTALAAQCRFSDCTHGREPGCAVRAALEAGTLDAARLKRFQKLQHEEARNSEQADAAQARFKRFGKPGKAAQEERRRQRDDG